MATALFTGCVEKFKRRGAEYVPYARDANGVLRAVAWAPQPGSQVWFLADPTVEVLYEGTRGPGKGLPLDEPVYTPLGPTPIGNLKVGSLVLCPDGTRSQVIGVFPQGKRQTYQIEFDDGATTVCDDVHIWPIHVQGQPTKRKFEYRLMNMPEVLRRFKKGDRLHIPTLDVLNFQTHPRLLSGRYPIDPYILGLYLGDGSSTQGMPRYCTADQELADAVLAAGATEWSSDKRNGLMNFGMSVLREPLTELGLLKLGSREKSVPRLYQIAPGPVRLAILQGLMDTDGSVDENGSIEFVSSSEKLLDDVQWLVRSLGGKATKTRHYNDAWRLYIQTGGKFNPFRLTRKAGRIVGYQHSVLRRRIVDISERAIQETVCIKIDHPLGLFVTRDCIVTHNTDALIMDFCQEVGKGWGAEWKGILFRQSHPMLRDVIEKSKKWIKRIWPEAIYNEVKTMWEWPTGERLYFSHFNVRSDYDNYHGHAYPWIGWEELTNWPNSDCYRSMFSCSRSTIKGMPRKIRATTNPYGVGHNWVKSRWRLPINGEKGADGSKPTVGPLITDSVDADGNPEPPRRAIHGYLDENILLLETDPGYKGRIKTAARNASELAAWMEGSWDIVAGGMFDDIWYEYRDAVIVPPFDIPRGWKIYRAYDHGSSKPFSVGWYAKSDGSDVRFPEVRNLDGTVTPARTRSTVRGDLFRFKEWYGWRGQPNEGMRMLIPDIAKGIVEREVKWGLRAPDGSWTRVSRGPADSAIFDDNNNGSDVSIANDFEKPVIFNNVKFKGIYWERADKGPGSREQGWEQIRKRLRATKKPEGGYRENAGLFVTTDCIQWLRCVPVLPRDETKIDDVDDEAEDHNGDETRYMLRFDTGPAMKSGRVGA
jgi:hypothetical protein